MNPCIKEELARKTRDIQRMAAEIRELRSNPKEHFRIEHDPLEPLRYNRMSTNQRFRDESVNEQLIFNNDHQEEQFRHDKNWKNTNTNKNTQYWTYDTSEDNLHPILRPLIDHQHLDDLNIQNQQPYNFHESTSDHQDQNDSTHLEGRESFSIEPMEELNDVNYSIPLQTNQKHELHHFSYVLPCHYVEGLLENYPKNDTNLQSKNDQAKMYLYIAPKKIVIEKKIIVETNFEEKISMLRPTSYKQNTKLNKTNWSLNPPILDNEILYNNQYPSDMIAESSQNENNDHLSIKLEIFDQMPRCDNITNNINEIQQHLSFNDTPIKQESMVQENKINNIDDQTHSKVYFHHTTEDERKGKVYYKTPKHSYSGSKIGGNGYDEEEEELNYEISNIVSKNRSYVVSNYTNDNNDRNSRWSSPSQLALHNDNFDSKVESSFVVNQQDEEININSTEREYTHCQDAPNDILENQSYNDESRISHVHWGLNSSSDHVQIPTNFIVPNNNSNSTYESNLKNESDNNLSNVNHPIHSILHHSGEQHSHKEHINWGENSTSDRPEKLQNMHESITEVKPSHISYVQEFLQPHVSIDKELLSTEKITNDNKVDVESQESNEPPSLVDKILSSFQSSLNQTIPEETSQNVGSNHESTEKPTNVSLELQSTKDKTSSHTSNEIVTESTKDIVHQNKNAKFSKSPSFVQSFLSLFQSSPSKTQEENSQENENVIQSNESTNQNDNVNEVSTQSESESKNSQNVDKSDDVSIVSTIFSSFYESNSLKPSIVQSLSEGGNESLALNALSKENETQDKNVFHSSFENETIDDEEYYNELPHRKMDASRKASIDKVKKELFLKLGDQQEQGLDGTPPLNNLINNTLGRESEHAIVHLENNELGQVENFDKVLENKKEETSHFSLQNINHESRRYSIEKIDSNKLKDWQQRSQSMPISRTSLYSTFRDRPSKSTVNSQFSRGNEFITNIHEVKESMDVENVQESQVQVYDQSSIIQSKRISFDKNDVGEETSFDHNGNESMKNVFDNRIVESLMPSISQTPTISNNENQRNNKSITLSTDDENDPDKSILCVARIRFVFPGKSTTFTTSQNHATTNTSSTPNRSDFSVGLKFNNEKSED